MNRQGVFLFLLSLIAATVTCAQHKPGIFEPVFDAHDVAPQTATLIVTRLDDHKSWISNSERAQTRFIPASTSKIPHTLIALEMKVATPETVFKWDGQERTFASWNQDQTLRTAYRRSAVWVYQDIAQTLGPRMMESWLTQFEYGNHTIGDSDVTQYWLSGPLKISAREQVEFLRKYIRQELALSPATYAASRKIFKHETSGAYTLYAKTGWMYDEDAMDIGWFVGWVETDDPAQTYIFALNMDMPEQGDVRKRKPIVMKALTAIGAWPEQ